MATRDPTTGRRFLHGLTTLPLVGGGVTLIGQPTAAAVPVIAHRVERGIAEAQEAFFGPEGA
jgi:hypothetical protein